MDYLPREEIEGVWFDLSYTDQTDLLSKVFQNNWEFILVDPLYLFDADMNLEGLAKLQECDDSSSGDSLYFYLTMFADIDEFSTVWVENYSVEGVKESDKVQWQFAFAGMYFYPSKRDWCGIYLDCPCQDFVLLGADSSLISKIKANFKPSSLFTIEQIETLLEKRFGKSI
ncbi:hypothetical protein ACEV8A_24240 [Vibrio parahaemolyticus]|uniref:hypothetical protein n=1 Tax=Vibrio parahaemolyticus TaxID=670 RepID=UPI00046752E2|nr:hypothetical protein [Vibrio parahaemolyticus]EGQ7840048.1 hypothetical protein [Vibrio parahaemolyticus]ELA6986461.1 hypothetical protein [Vibrio parahaemolyticus]MBE3731251.1 hypothetical protein [Vibrio parahaemolyticus]MBE3858398.1 hypothetical protein [Vibrio parahaemolyticus]MBE4173898.1 hypothetical protein [Vibrio parahaemolyticus]